MKGVTRQKMMYEGKAKKVYATNNPAYVIVCYKDDATAFNGAKKGQIESKGVFKQCHYFGFVPDAGRTGCPDSFCRKTG